MGKEDKVGSIILYSIIGIVAAGLLLPGLYVVGGLSVQNAKEAYYDRAYRKEQEGVRAVQNKYRNENQNQNQNQNPNGGTKRNKNYKKQTKKNKK